MANDNSLLDIANNGAALNQAISELTTNVAKLSSIKLPVANGGTGADNASDARTNLGLGSASVLNTPITVANGGTGLTSLTQYAVLCGGTTTTGNVQSVASVGTSGQVLTSNGVGSLPTFQTIKGPAFSVYQSTAQPALPAGTFTKLVFQTKIFDTNNCFNNSTNYRFTPTVAGYYQINGAVRINGTITSSSITTDFRVALYINNTRENTGVTVGNNSNSPASVVSSLIFLNGTTDYVELWAITPTSLQPSASQQATYFNGCLMRTA